MERALLYFGVVGVIWYTARGWLIDGFSSFNSWFAWMHVYDDSLMRGGGGLLACWLAAWVVGYLIFDIRYGNGSNGGTNRH